MSREQITLLAVCGLIAALSVPLVLRRVPPNRIYGFRTCRTLADADLWYRANAFCGWALLLACLASAASIMLLPPPPDTFLQLVLPMLAAVAASIAYLRLIDR